MSKLTSIQTARYNELMRLAKSDEFMSESEYNELAGLLKIRGYH